MKTIHDIAAEKAMKERLRARLEELHKRRCPPSVLSGSYQYTVDYKEAMATAEKVLKSDRATTTALQRAGQALERFQ